MSIGELKYFLQQRGLPLSEGYGNLLARVGSGQNLPVLFAAERFFKKCKVLTSE